MPARIVVIDNEASMRDLFTFSLKTQGWQVFSYDYDHINLMALEQTPPDLIILDFNLRDEGFSWEFLQFLKMEDKTAKIPILITTTAFQLSAQVQDYLLLHYIKVVHKPFDVNAFLTLVKKTLLQASQSEVLFAGDRTLPILLVDDTEDLRDTISTVLRFDQYRVVTANNGLVALDTVSRADHCLILLDMRMPVMNGLEFLRAYEQQARPHSPVIVLSAEQDLRSRGLSSFVVDVLPKPFPMHHLLSRVGEFAQPV